MMIILVSNVCAHDINISSTVDRMDSVSFSVYTMYTIHCGPQSVGIDSVYYLRKMQPFPFVGIKNGTLREK